MSPTTYKTITYKKRKRGNKKGRLCNQVIRNLALSMLARNNDLYVNYSSFDQINNILGIELFVGKQKYTQTKVVKNSNYMECLMHPENTGYNLNRAFFQSEEITSLLYKHLQLNNKNIINKNPYKNRYKNNNDLFLHIRLGDVAKFNVGIQYYINHINKIKYDNLYIGSDEFSHDMIKEIKTLYPDVIFIEKDPINTIQFGSTCKYIILSHGSFSAVIGYLAFDSNIYFPNCKPGWCALGMFSNKGWIGGSCVQAGDAGDEGRTDDSI
mgnify:CR=1 FL=1